MLSTEADKDPDNRREKKENIIKCQCILLVKKKKKIKA